VCARACVHACMYVYMHACMYECMRVCVWYVIYLYMCLCMFAYMYVWFQFLRQVILGFLSDTFYAFSFWTNMNYMFRPNVAIIRFTYTYIRSHCTVLVMWTSSTSQCS
jgi:hypothetical protein